jgi:hypothetical protein
MGSAVSRENAPVPDLMAWWSSASWLSAAIEWIESSLAAAGIRVTGSIEQPRVRFWGTALTVPTDAGLVWFKANHPNQAFEAALVERLGRFVPERVLPVLAVERTRGWMLTTDQGPTLAHHDGDRWEHRERVVREYAILQRDLCGHREALLATGLGVLDPRDAPDRLLTRIEDFASLPGRHPFALGPEAATAARAQLPLMVRASTVLAESGIPLSLEHNDLHDNNAFIPEVGSPLRFFDFADAFWAHPFASLFIPMGQVLDDDDPTDPRDHPHGRALIDGYLDAWDHLAPRNQLIRAVHAALVVGHLHRLESWWRVAQGTPAEQLEPWRGVGEYFLLERFPQRWED